MRFAALDLGSNSFLCLIGEGNAQEITRILSDDVELVRLGEGLSKTKFFNQDALTRADEALSKFAKTIDRLRPQKVLAMATAAARDAENKNELFDLCHKYKIPLQIIPGDQEARITFQGAQCKVRPLERSAENQEVLLSENKKNLVIDTGGRSTEIILGQGNQFFSGMSLSLGVVELTESFGLNGPIASREIFLAKKTIQQKLSGLAQEIQLVRGENQLSIKALAGTPTTLAQIFIGKYDPDKIENMEISQKSIETQILEFSQRTSFQIERDFKIPQKRADVILAGSLILSGILDFFQKDKIYVSTKGVRFGVAMEILRGVE